MSSSHLLEVRVVMEEPPVEEAAGNLCALAIGAVVRIRGTPFRVDGERVHISTKSF